MKFVWTMVFMAGCAMAVTSADLPSRPSPPTEFSEARDAMLQMCPDCDDPSYRPDRTYAGWGMAQTHGPYVTTNPDNDAVLRDRYGEDGLVGLYDHEMGHIISLHFAPELSDDARKKEWEMASDRWAGCLLNVEGRRPEGFAAFLFGEGRWGYESHPDASDRVPLVLAGWLSCGR